MSKCIVSFSSMGRENYNQAQLRLIKSIKWSGWDGGVVMQSYDGYVDEYKGVKIELGSYPKSEKYNLQNNNSEIPYGFKPEIVLGVADDLLRRTEDKFVYAADHQTYLLRKANNFDL